MGLSTRAKVGLITAFLFTGAVNTLTKKFQLQTCSVGLIEVVAQTPGCPPGSKRFSKPWTQNLQMFLGESLLLSFFYLRRRRMPKLLSDDGAPVGNTAPPYIFLLPASCDVMGTGIGGVGMLYISASVWQMMRGSLLVFTSFLSVFFLKRELYGYNYFAVCTSTVGLALVGCSAMLDGDGAGSSNVGLGIALTVLSQFFAASQMVIEELYVKKRKCPAEQVVGSEGVWGICIMIVLLSVMYNVPGSDDGSYENVFDSWKMISDSATLSRLIALYTVSIASFNFLGVTIAGQLSSLHRTINDAMRTGIVWVVQLALFYAGDKTYGTGWLPHSWMQLAGFVFLICGSLINHRILLIPGLWYPFEEKARPIGMSFSPTHQSMSIAASGVSGFSPVASPGPGPLEAKLLAERGPGDAEFQISEEVP